MKRTIRFLLIVMALLLTVTVGARATHVGAQNVAPSTVPVPHCLNVQLATRPYLATRTYRESGAASHVAVMYAMHNISKETCSLYGWPGAMLLSFYYDSLPTDVHRVTDLFGFHPPREFNLASGGTAYFVLEWADVPTSNESCHAATYIMITAPNDHLPDVTDAALNQGRITPCGGHIMASTLQPTAFRL